MTTKKDNSASHFEKIKRELEEAKQDFLWLINEFSDNDWDRNLPGGPWTAKEEMVHIVQALEVIPKGIKRAIDESGGRSILSFIPSPIRSWINGYILIPKLAKRSTKESIITAYEKAFQSLVEILGRIPENDWGKGAKYPRKYRTVEQMAHRPREHFEEHAVRLCKKLGISRDSNRNSVN